MTTSSKNVPSSVRGAGPIRQLYRQSHLRRLVRVRIPHRGLKANDVFVASYPRSGNAWLAFVLLELAGRRAGFDTVRLEVPIVGAHARAPSLAPAGGRFIKTHEPYLPVYRRAVHLVRDPRDVALSYFRFMQRDGRLVLGPDDDVAQTFDSYLDSFIAGRLNPHGTWQTHLDSWLDAAAMHRADILRIRYEDMRADTPAAITDLAAWLGFKVTAGEVEAVAERCSLENMREAEREVDPVVFGKVRAEVAYVGPASLGDWRAALTRVQQSRFSAFVAGIAALGYEAPIQP